MIDRANQLYSAHITDPPFVQALAMYLRFGHVASHPDLFLMAKPVCTSATPEQIEDPTFTHEDPNAWHIALAVGSLARCVQAMPFQLDYLIFRRRFRGALRCYKAERLLHGYR